MHMDFLASNFIVFNRICGSSLPGKSTKIHETHTTHAKNWILFWCSGVLYFTKSSNFKNVSTLLSQ